MESIIISKASREVLRKFPKSGGMIHIKQFPESTIQELEYAKIIKIDCYNYATRLI